MINTRKDREYWEPSRKGFITNYPNFQHWKRLEPARMNVAKPLNVYVHTPYCIQRCAYCYYKTINLRGTEKSRRMGEYVNAMCKEIELASEYYQLGDRPVVSIYLGGGTPSLLNEDQLSQLAETLRKHLNTNAETEFTVEAEPVTLNKVKAETLKNLGVNRISMGVQSFDDDIIRRSNRLDNEKKALEAIEIAKTTDAVINIDLMSGLAGETTETWHHSVQRAISTEVGSITVYKTELYTNTPYYQELRKQTLDLPDEDRELEFMQYAIDELDQAGYSPWSFFTFTKEGHHQHTYATSTFLGDDCYAFGLSSFGRLGQYQFQNTNEEQKYIDLLEAGELPVARGHYMTSMDEMIRDVVMRMKLLRFDLRSFEERHGFRLEALSASALEELRSGDFITVSEDEIALTPKGVLHGDYVGKRLAKSLMELN